MSDDDALESFQCPASSKCQCIMQMEETCISHSPVCFNSSFCMASHGTMHFQSYSQALYEILYAYLYRFSKTQLSKKVENEFMVVRGLILPFYFKYIKLYLAVCIITCIVDIIGMCICVYMYVCMYVCMTELVKIYNLQYYEHIFIHT